MVICVVKPGIDGGLRLGQGAMGGACVSISPLHCSAGVHPNTKLGMFKNWFKKIFQNADLNQRYKIHTKKINRKGEIYTITELYKATLNGFTGDITRQVTVDLSKYKSYTGSREHDKILDQEFFMWFLFGYKSTSSLRI